MRKSIFLTSLVISALLLSACQSGQVSNPNSSSTNDRPRITDQTKSADDNLPVLKTKQSGLAGEFKLRSQTSRYLTSNKSSAEIILSNTTSAFCQKQKPTLLDEEQQIRIIIKSKDGKTAVSKGETVGNSNFELSLSKVTKAGEQKLDSLLITSLNITDLNNAILRGNLKSSASSDGKIESYDGEFFTAICK